MKWTLYFVKQEVLKVPDSVTYSVLRIINTVILYVFLVYIHFGYTFCTISVEDFSLDDYTKMKISVSCLIETVLNSQERSETHWN